ncbi:MAG TPA: twin-arginine translocase subunit TatC, partial [Gemmatimonadaceae bacterium]|nr:twin-arginine translocase subunit TatC [Gemmatimonadaceae bacterium]
MPFLDHLEELRWRILKALAALVAGVGIAFYVITRFDVIGVLERPITPYLHGAKLVYTHPGDPFQITLTAAVALGIVLALPVIVYQVWAFLAPALYQHEKRLVVPVLVSSCLFFALGMAFAYFFVFPVAFGFFAGYTPAGVQ